MATFNIRYDNPGDSLNSWKYRKEKVCEFIREKHPDVLGMQEVLNHQLKDLLSGLPDYAYVGVGREDNPSAYRQCIEMHCYRSGPCKRNHAYGCT